MRVHPAYRLAKRDRPVDTRVTAERDCMRAERDHALDRLADECDQNADAIVTQGDEMRPKCLIFHRWVFEREDDSETIYAGAVDILRCSKCGCRTSRRV